MKRLILFVLDISASMRGERIEQLRHAVAIFFERLNSRDLDYNLYSGFVLFNHKVQFESQIFNVRDIKLPSFEASGNTSIAKGVSSANKISDNWLKQNNGIVWMILITDADSIESKSSFPKSFYTLFGHGENKFYAFGIDKNNMDNLIEFSPSRDQVFLLNKYNLQNLFLSLSHDLVSGATRIDTSQNWNQNHREVKQPIVTKTSSSLRSKKRAVIIGPILMILLVLTSTYLLFFYDGGDQSALMPDDRPYTLGQSNLSLGQFSAIFAGQEKLLHNDRAVFTIFPEHEKFSLEEITAYYNLGDPAKNEVVFLFLKEFNPNILNNFSEDYSHLKEITKSEKISTESFRVPTLKAMMLEEFKGNTIAKKQKLNQIKITRIQ